VQRRLVVEVAIGAVERKGRCRNRHHPRAAAEMPHLVTLARREHDDLVTRGGTGAQLALDIGFHAAAMRRVEGADIDDPHHVTSRQDPSRTAHDDNS
jgi:hypothetical protein